MNELVAFVLARVAEDQDLAHAALHDPGFGGVLGAYVHGGHADRGQPNYRPRYASDDPLARHIAQQHPGKVIADCQAKQRLVAHLQSIHRDDEATSEQNDVRILLELLAMSWNQHADYRTTWVS
ncbi:DUF6221 family protein [Arthrobacter sp. CAN_A214]|uniref:DUF6221 family protein n=1 Tax=Arthrobacter sp. CAN_A214 TaxID=2787720 RepID=UPI002FF39E6C